MSFAVIQTGGKQYKVKAGEIIKIERLENSKAETKIYCGHEYTLKNSEFCIKYDENNSKLKEKIISLKKKLEKGLPTVPSTIKEELDCNIFLRSKDVESFSKLRDLKDNF